MTWKTRMLLNKASRFKELQETRTKVQTWAFIHSKTGIVIKIASKGSSWSFADPRESCCCCDSTV